MAKKTRKKTAKRMPKPYAVQNALRIVEEATGESLCKPPRSSKPNRRI